MSNKTRPLVENGAPTTTLRNLAFLTRARHMQGFVMEVPTTPLNFA